jgi:hypothetical protein
MRSFVLAAISALVASAIAIPSPTIFKRTPTIFKRTLSTCMSDAQATTVANNFGSLLSDYSTAFANQTLTTDFTDYSDSVIELINNGCSGPDAVCIILTQVNKKMTNQLTGVCFLR